MLTRRRALLPAAALGSLALLQLLRDNSVAVAVEPPPAAVATPPGVVSVERLAGGVTLATTLLPAQRQPEALGLVREGFERYQRTIRDYTCVFDKQERIGGKLRAVEEIEVRYRESPRSVYMLWRRNPDQARRALFIDQPQFVDRNGRKLARVEPAGPIARLFVPDLYLPIHGPEARKVSRRTIDEFGFREIFELFEHYNALAARDGVLDVRYGGTGRVAGRPTHVLIRRLPYTGPDGPYPDALLILHLDQEWLLPTAVYSYADPQGQELLGSYVFRDVRLNPGLTDADFRF